jgi:hypothetical protein
VKEVATALDVIRKACRHILKHQAQVVGLADEQLLLNAEDLGANVPADPGRDPRAIVELDQLKLDLRASAQHLSAYQTVEVARNGLDHGLASAEADDTGLCFGRQRKQLTGRHDAQAPVLTSARQ